MKTKRNLNKMWHAVLGWAVVLLALTSCSNPFKGTAMSPVLKHLEALNAPVLTPEGVLSSPRAQAVEQRNEFWR